jgi:divalent metal cation (Fe/Co/Zn/Cd) transporter
MEAFFLQLLNFFFFSFHTALILFNLLGWLFPKTRKLHLISLLITLFSWGILGIWNGFGYCFLTDWHYQVLRKLGERHLSNSYISFLTEKFTGWLPGTALVDTLTLALILLALLCAIWVNFFVKKNE